MFNLVKTKHGPKNPRNSIRELPWGFSQTYMYVTCIHPKKTTVASFYLPPLFKYLMPAKHRAFYLLLVATLIQLAFGGFVRCL